MNPSTRLATDLIAGLVRAGVREVVLCPGSRSAPLAYAAWAAERSGLLRLHVRVDERSAGFLALGLAKLTRRPAAVVTTSGTAVANLHPAVLEAHHANVPLLVLSADRPLALRHSGANQTTTQPGMYAAAVRWEVDLAADDVAGDAVAHNAVRAAEGAQTGRPGPVHLNIQFREPLTPTPCAPSFPPEVGSLRFAREAKGGEPHHSRELHAARERHAAREPQAAQPPAGWPETEQPVPDLPPRTLVVLGDLADPAQAATVVAWAGVSGYPVVAEPFGLHAPASDGSQPANPVVPQGVLLLGNAAFLNACEPEAVLVVGRPTLSRPVSRLLRRPGPALVAASGGLVFDVPERSVTLLDLALLTPNAARPAGDPPWCRAWLDAGAQVAAAVDADPPAWGTGPALARAVTAALPTGSVLFLGSSNTPRDLEIAVSRIPSGTTMIGNRGLAGIDGCVSTAMGLALSEPQRAAFALMGDLTFLHDSGGLLIGPDEPRPDLTIVVANDDGGGIFTTLEPGEPERAEAFERLFGTPTGTDLAALCHAHGIRHERVSDPHTLAARLGQRPRGLRVIEVPIDRASHRAERERLHQVAAAAVGD